MIIEPCFPDKQKMPKNSNFFYKYGLYAYLSLWNMPSLHTKIANKNIVRVRHFVNCWRGLADQPPTDTFNMLLFFAI